jgi:hypothetical protein
MDRRGEDLMGFGGTKKPGVVETRTTITETRGGRIIAERSESEHIHVPAAPTYGAYAEVGWTACSAGSANFQKTETAAYVKLCCHQTVEGVDEAFDCAKKIAESKLAEGQAWAREVLEALIAQRRELER